VKEIDFLPEWYKDSRRRRINYCKQYLALGAMFVIMLVWNSVATHSILKTTEQITQMTSRQIKAKNVSTEFAKISSRVKWLQKQKEFMEKIDPRIDVANVLAEMSFLIDEKIVLNQVEFTAERFVDESAASAGTETAVRVARGSFTGKKEALPLGNMRFKVVISGVAENAGVVAKLICKLEDSPYFCAVYPSFSRNKQIKPVRNSPVGHNKVQEGKISDGVRTATNLVKETPNVRNSILEPGMDFQVSEFEISCYLANYRKG